MPRRRHAEGRRGQPKPSVPPQRGTSSSHVARALIERDSPADACRTAWRMARARRNGRGARHRARVPRMRLGGLAPATPTIPRSSSVARPLPTVGRPHVSSQLGLPSRVSPDLVRASSPPASARRSLPRRNRAGGRLHPDDARREPHEVASRAHHLVSRELRAPEGGAGGAARSATALRPRRTAYLFNSYYERRRATGTRAPHRGLASRPTLREVLAYRAHRRRSTCKALGARARGGDRRRGWATALRLAHHHEEQHQELLLTDLRHVLGTQPLPSALPARRAGHAGHAHGTRAVSG